MEFRTAKDITKEDIEWALDEAFEVIMEKIVKERIDARNARSRKRTSD